MANLSLLMMANTDMVPSLLVEVDVVRSGGIVGCVKIENQDVL